MKYLGFVIKAAVVVLVILAVGKIWSFGTEAIQGSPLGRLMFPGLCVEGPQNPKINGIAPERLSIEASGIWAPTHTLTPEDSVEVTVGIVVTESDTVVTCMIDSTPVVIDSFHVSFTPPSFSWELYSEVANTHRGAGAGLGVGYLPLHFQGLHAGCGVSYGMGDEEYLAVGGRLSTDIHLPLRLGVGVGVKIFEGDEWIIRDPINWHIGVGLSLALAEE